MADKHVIKVAVHVGKGILVHAKGHPAKVVAFGAAAGVAAVATAIGYGTVVGTKEVFKKLGLIKEQS